MHKHHVHITNEVREVLLRSIITDKSVTLPEGRLDRSLYTAVNKVLTLAGGKWNTKAQAHLFPSDPREVLGLALENGAIKDQKKATQAFYTPARIADRLVQIAGIESGDCVLEPSAGHGAIADAIVATGAQVYCYEIDPASVAVLRSKGHSVEECDFLSHDVALFDAIVMNPPFSGGQDIAHVTHAFKKFLRPGGMLVAIMSPGWQTAQTTKAKEFRELVRLNGEIEEELEPGTFAESGTNVATVIVRMSR